MKNASQWPASALSSSEKQTASDSSGDTSSAATSKPAAEKEASIEPSEQGHLRATRSKIERVRTRVRARARETVTFSGYALRSPCVSPGKMPPDGSGPVRRSSRVSGGGGKVSQEQLATHSTPSDLWVSVRGKVYDVTEWCASPALARRTTSIRLTVAWLRTRQVAHPPGRGPAARRRRQGRHPALRLLPPAASGVRGSRRAGLGAPD